MFFMVLGEESSREKCKRLYMQYHRDIFEKAFSLLHDHYDAEDAAQEAWTAIFKNIHMLSEDDPHTLKATLLTVVKYKAIDLFRKRCKTSEMHEPIETADWDHPVSDSVFSEICENESVEVLFSCMKEMDEKYTDVLRLYYLQGHTTREIAKLFSLNVKTVETRLARGRTILCQKLKEKGYA
ncbi:MAG: RNA polymerase sigma factor [Clostridia bacterium]|nr:RNA polymerase sigma factor [Clostridia bacterium]